MIAVTDVEVLVDRGEGPVGRDPGAAAARTHPHRHALAAAAHTIRRLEDLAFLDATHRVMRVVLNVATAGSRRAAYR